MNIAFLLVPGTILMSFAGVMKGDSIPLSITLENKAFKITLCNSTDRPLAYFNSLSEKRLVPALLYLEVLAEGHDDNSSSGKLISLNESESDSLEPQLSSLPPGACVVRIVNPRAISDLVVGTLLRHRLSKPALRFRFVVKVFRDLTLHDTITGSSPPYTAAHLLMTEDGTTKRKRK